jgi:hypothetical protein
MQITPRRYFGPQRTSKKETMDIISVMLQRTSKKGKQNAMTN